MKPYIYQDPTDGMWVVASGFGERRFLHRRWAFKHAHTPAVQVRRTMPFGFSTGGILDGSDPDWRILDPGYPANRTAPAVMA